MKRKGKFKGKFEMERKIWKRLDTVLVMDDLIGRIKIVDGSLKRGAGAASINIQRGHY